MFIEKLALPSRTFLRGIGVTMAPPPFDALVAAQTAMAKPVRRFNAVLLPLGAGMDRWTHKFGVEMNQFATSTGRIDL